MDQFLKSFFAMGPYAYFIIAMFIIVPVFAIVSMKMNKNSLQKWLNDHPNAVRIGLESGGFITQKEIYAEIVDGEGQIFTENTGYAIYAVPGDLVVELTYTYTRPGVMYKKVSTTWGPARVSISVEANKEYALSFDRDEETFKLIEK